MHNDRFKFRVWDNARREWRVDLLWLSQDGGLCAEEFCDDGAGNDCTCVVEKFSDDFIIEQCTGIRDRNGKLIYEGDVVLFVGKVNLAVQYTPNGWEMAGDDVNVPLTKNAARFVKIVGTIHER